MSFQDATLDSYRRLALIFSGRETISKGALRIFAAALSFLALAVVSHFIFPHLAWENRQLFSVVDGSGAIVSILLGIVLLLIRPYRPKSAFLFSAALALMGMGLALAAKSFTERTNVSLWLDNFDTVLGAVLFATIWLPERWVERWATTRTFMGVASVCLALSVLLLFCADSLPRATDGLEFSSLTKIVNFLGGLVYLVVARHFFLKARFGPGADFASLATICFFFGLAGIVLPFSELWSVNWWLVQLAQCVPVFIALRYVFQTFTQSQEALFLSERRFKTIFSEAPIGIGVVGPERTYVQSNPALVSLLGYPESELPSIPLRTFVHPEDLPDAIARRADIVQPGQKTYRQELRLLTRRETQTPVWVRITASYIRDAAGVTREVQLIEDITAERNATAKASSLVEDLSRSNAELDRFAAMVSHDLRSPLTTVTSYLDLLGRRSKVEWDPASREWLTFASDAAKRMRLLIDDLLSFTRATKSTEKVESVSLEAVIGEVLANLDSEIRETGARLSFGPMPDVMGNRTQLLQLFQNLIGNSLKYRSEAPPVVELKVQNTNREWLFEISDNGVGFKREEAEKIFEPFRRLGQVSERPGTGLGLSICRAIVERHGGRIWATSEATNGSQFFIVLPKAI